MKRKYFNIVSFAIIMLALAGSAFYVASDVWKKDSKIKITRSAPVKDIVIPPPYVMKEIDQYTKEITDLILISKKNESQTSLRLFGFKDTPDNNYPDGDEISDIDTEYVFSLAFKSGQKRICIIDSEFYTEGSFLPDGFQIKKIESTKVLLKKNGEKKWIFPLKQVSLSQNRIKIKKHASKM